MPSGASPVGFVNLGSSRRRESLVNYSKSGRRHIDIKKLGHITRVGHRIDGDRQTRTIGAGWDHVYIYVCVDDATRLAFIEVRPREDRFEATAFLQRAAQWFARRNIAFERVMTDNGMVFENSDQRRETLAARNRF